MTGIGINAGAAANAEEITVIDNVIDNAKRSIPSIVTYYAISGNLRIRVPVASKIALPTAGAMPTMGVSPAPAETMSLRSSSTLSITGMSANRGTR